MRHETPHPRQFTRFASVATLVALLAGSAVAAGTVGAWREISPLQTERLSHAAGFVGGRVYAIGGAAADHNWAEAVERYEPGSGVWTERGPLPENGGFVAAVARGRLYAIGGQPPSNREYDPATDTWAAKQGPPVGLLDPSAAASGGRIYVFSVHWEDIGFEALAYDPGSDSWTRIPQPPAPSMGACAAAVAGKVYLIGGIWDPILSSVYEYDPATESWDVKRSMPTPRYELGCVAVGGLIYAIGGRDSSGRTLATVEVYDPRADQWWDEADMPIERSTFGAVAAGSKIYAIGGHGPVLAQILDRVDVFDTGATGLAAGAAGKLTVTWGAMKRQ